MSSLTFYTVCFYLEADTGGLLKYFANLTAKHLQACNFIKKGLKHTYFPVKFRNFLTILKLYVRIEDYQNILILSC